MIKVYLKWLRVFLAIIFFLPVSFFFIDFMGILPNGVGHLLHLQIIPAILGGFVGIFLLQALLAFVVGRIYCSVICPAGVLQDIINRIYCIGRKKKNGTRRFKQKKAMNTFRYGLLGLTAVLALFGATNLLMILDPYSNFGRIANNLVRPLYKWGNNIAADVLMHYKNYSLYHVDVTNVPIFSAVAAIIALVVFVVMVALRGRLFCNTLCPVGAGLSLISRYSLLRVSFDKESCTKCGVCSKGCKAEAIDVKNMTVDTSRCVDCFNCMPSCPKGALSFSFKSSFKTATEESAPIPSSEDGKGNSRRQFIATSAVVAGTIPTISAIANVGEPPVSPTLPIIPPGAINLERFKDKCTACHLCVAKCPSHVLRPAGFEYGFDFLLRPHCSFYDSYCNYQCTVCSEVCPTGAIKFLTEEEKKVVQIGIAEFNVDICIVKTDNTDCGACSEHCPLQAVRMVPYKGTLTIPEVTPELCVGCGGCESICPVRPERAIIVRAKETHVIIELPEEEEVRDIRVDDFGF